MRHHPFDAQAGAEASARVDPTVDRPDPARLIAVGVAEADHDRAALCWTVAEARSGVDVVHIVHAYAPLRLEGSSWSPVVAARDARRYRARRVVATAEQRLRSASPDLSIGGSAVAGLGWDVLREFSAVVDLIVLGEDDPGVDFATTASRVARIAQCPVVTVPADYRLGVGDPGRPVTVLLDSAAPAESLVDFARVEARRRGAPLNVVQCWSGPDDGNPAVVPELRQASCLLVAGADAPHVGDLAAPRLIGRCPLITVPL